MLDARVRARTGKITDLVSHRDERVLAGETCRLTFSALELYNVQPRI